jgi:hypothetical protein
MIFSVYNIFFKEGTENWTVVNGEIRNESNIDYRAAIFRIFIFDKQRKLGNGVIKIHNFRGYSTRTFEVLIEGLSYKSIPSIVRHEIIFESGY